MATTRTPGIIVLSDGRRFIDKRYLGVRIGLRVGAVTQEQAEERLDIEIARVQWGAYQILLQHQLLTASAQLRYRSRVQCNAGACKATQLHFRVQVSIDQCVLLRIQKIGWPPSAVLGTAIIALIAVSRESAGKHLA
jgi:hypothetical protein